MVLMLPLPRPMATLLVLALLASLVGCVRQQSTRELRVMVVQFENATPDSGFAHGQALADLMTGVLANTQHVAVLERQGLRPPVEPAGELSLVELGRRAGADYLIIGSVSRLENNFVVGTRLLSVQSGQVVRNSALTRACRREQDLYPLIQGMATQTATQLKLISEMHFGTPAAAAAVEAPATPTATPATGGES